MKFDRTIGSIFLDDRSFKVGDAETHSCSFDPDSQCGGVEADSDSIFIGGDGCPL
jgi:hypothetical protein